MLVTENNTKAEIVAEYGRLKDEIKANGIVLSGRLIPINKASTKAEYLEAIGELSEILDDMEYGSDEYDYDDNNVEQLSFIDDEKNHDVHIPELSKVNKDKSRSEKTKQESAREICNISLDMLNGDILVGLNNLRTSMAGLYQNLDTLNKLDNDLDELAAVINAGREKLMKLEEENGLKLEDMHRKNEQLLSEINENGSVRIAEIEKKIEEKSQEIEAARAEKNAKREKEQEEYLYSESVKHKMEDDRWEDEKTRREEQILIIEAEIEEIKKILEEKETQVPRLEKELSELPKLIEKAEAEGMTEREKELLEEQEHQKALFIKDAEAETASLEQKIADMKEDYEALLVERDTAQAKLDKAYEDNHKLYLQTVQSTGGIKILNGTEK